MRESRSQPWPLPPGVVPIGLTRLQSAAYVGVSPSLYDKMVDDGRMPKPKRVNRRSVWDRFAVEAAFRNLDDGRAESGGSPPDHGPPDEDWGDVAP